MGWLGRVLSFTRRQRGSTSYSDTKVDAGGGDNLTAQHFGAPGDDSHPLPSDTAALLPLPGTGRAAAVAYLDPANDQLAGPGERRIYSRNSAGQAVARVWLQDDGSAVIDNGSGGIVLGSDGTVSINGVEIDPSGNISAPGDADFTGDVTAATLTADQIEAVVSLIAATLELVLHTHLAGTPPGNTGPNQ